MAGLFRKVEEIKRVDVNCPDCGKGFAVEFHPRINASYYHAVKSDGTKVLEMSYIHTREERNLKCPYCGSKFIEKREWK